MNLFLILGLICASLLEGQGRPTGVSTVTVLHQPGVQYSSFVHHNPFVRLSPLPTTYVHQPLVYHYPLGYHPSSLVGVLVQPVQVLQPPATTAQPTTEQKTPDTATAAVTVAPPTAPPKAEVPSPSPPPDYPEASRPEVGDPGAIVHEDGSVDTPPIEEVEQKKPEDGGDLEGLSVAEKEEKPEVEENTAQDDDDTIAVDSSARKDTENDDPETE